MLEKVLASEAFRGSARSAKLLRFLVEHEAKGESDQLKEYSLGADALGRGPSFDPRLDSIVRVEVARLRNRLDQYYLTEGRQDPVVIVLPKGTYVPRWEPRASNHALTDALHGKRQIPRSVSVLLGIAALTAVAFWYSGLRGRRPATGQHFFDVRLVEGLQVGGGTIGTHVVLSPDGARVAFVGWERDGVSRLFTRRLNELDATELPDTDGAQAPFFSPDGSWIAFISTRDRRLKKVAVAGGVPIDLAEASDILGATWSDNNEIIARLDATARLWRIPTDGSAPRPVIVQVPPDADPRIWPQGLPGGRSMIVTIARQRGFDAAEIGVLSLSDGSIKTLIRGGTFGRYLASGHIAYINQGTLYAAPLHLDRLELEGSPVPILSGVDYNRLFGYAQYDISRTGLLAYRRTTSEGPFEVAWIEPGHDESTLLRPGRYSWPRISPDGFSLAVVRQESGGSSLWVKTAQRGPSIPIASGPAIIASPVWSPDGHRLLFASRGSGVLEAPANGSGKARLIIKNTGVVIPWSFHPDGRRLAYQLRSPEAAHFDLWTIPLDGPAAGKPEPFLTTPAVEVFPTFSPDGAWLAYLSNRTGAFELYVRGFPDRESREFQLTQTGAMAFRWPAKGHEILYRTPEQRIFSLRCGSTGSRFECDPPRQWSNIELAESGVLPNFDVTPDGRRAAGLLKTNRDFAANLSQATFVIGFFDELGRRLSARAAPGF
jgi:serine/threonine-protein kinase